MSENQSRPPTADGPPDSRPSSPPAAVERSGEGWSIRIPLGEQRISVEKRVFVREELAVEKVARASVVQMTETVKSERLKLEGANDPR